MSDITPDAPAEDPRDDLTPGGAPQQAPGADPSVPGADEGAAGETIGATGDAQDSALEKDPSDWVSGDDPMTQSQKSYLDTLAKRAGEELPADLTKAQASEHIDRLRGDQG